MNTHGPWQEDFSWRLDKMYGYSIPVSLFKYGNIKLRALLDLSQKKYVKIFAQEILKLSKEINSGKPDVIAHSYGTLLLSEVLKMDENADIKLGRIILAGSIVRPDYDWNKVITNGQVEAVMCHYSPKDFWVKMSHYTIPGSGPSGCMGFNDGESVVHSREETYGHSDYFHEDNIDHVMNEVWAPFLTKNIVNLSAQNKGVNKEPNWSESKIRYITHSVKFVLILAIVIFVFILCMSIWLGFPDAWDLVTSCVRPLCSDMVNLFSKQV